MIKLLIMNHGHKGTTFPITTCIRPYIRHIKQSHVTNVHIPSRSSSSSKSNESDIFVIEWFKPRFFENKKDGVSQRK